jgi:DNA polymerase III alpha subunit
MTHSTSSFGATPMAAKPPEWPDLDPDLRSLAAHPVNPAQSSGYVELHAHSCFSFLEGSSHVDELVLTARVHGYPALALTDHDGLHGAMEFARIARDNDLKPITGAELTLENGHHLTLLAETLEGYHNLCRLVSYAHMASERGSPVTRLDDLRQHCSGLIALSGCKKGEIASLLSEGHFEQARDVALRFRDWFGSANFWIELQHNLVYGDSGRIEKLVHLADELNLGYVATNNAHYHVRERHQLQDVMVAIKHRSTLDASHRLRRENSEYYLKSVAEMTDLFARYPGAVSNTLRIAGRIQFDLTKDLDYTFPDYPVPDGYDTDSWLQRICYESAAHRYSGNFRPASIRKVDPNVGQVEDSPISSVGEGESFERSSKVPYSEIHPPYPTSNIREPQPEAGGLGVSPSNRPARSTPNASTTRASRPSHALRGSAVSSLEAQQPEAGGLGVSPSTGPARSASNASTTGTSLPSHKLRNSPSSSAKPPLPTIPPDVQQRLDQELALIRKHELSGFFLIYRDLMNLAREVADGVRQKHRWASSESLPPGRGRGSSVGSIVCYLIGLSHVDPLQHNLFVGRFLNDELRSVPDIDLDFARDIREELILSVYKKFGHEYAALVCTYPTYRTRSAIRDVGKALGLPAPELDKLAKLSGHYSSKEVYEEMEQYPEFRDRIDAPLWRDLVRLAYEIAGMPRHVSQHVGGMIISSTPVIEQVPVEKAAMPGRVVCQWDKDGVDDAGFIKIDFLALGMLSMVDEALELIEERHGKRIDLSRIDFQDEKVYDDICAGDTIGVFQIESRAQIQTLPRTRPRTIEDLTVEVAIIRPGPIVGGAVNPYIKRRQGKEPVTYDHPSLQECLEETLGVILFQEQVIQVSMALAGFSSGQAESLRRAMSRKRSRDAMAALWQQFLDGCLERGVSEKIASTVFEKLMGFAEFGFPKSHAAAFALLAYQSAWLKRYYPAEFYCALYNAQPMGFYPPHVLTNDAKRHGIEILRPDVNKSLWRCTVEDLTAEDGEIRGAVRIGLSYVQGIADQHEKILDRESPARTIPAGAVPISSVGEGESFEHSTKTASGEIHPPDFPSYTSKPQPEAGGLGVSPSNRPARSTPNAATPARRSSVGEGESFERSTKTASSQIHPPYPTKNSSSPQPEAGGLGVSPSNRPARSASNASATGTSRPSHVLRNPLPAEATRPYTSIHDFCRRTGLRREAVENLIAVGAFDSFGLNRRELIWRLGLVYPQVAAIPKEAAETTHRRPPGAHRMLPLVIRDGDGNLYNPYHGWPLSSDQEAKAARNHRRHTRSRQLSLALPTDQDMVRLKDMNDWERLVVDYNLLHLSPDNHPLKALRPLLNEGIVSSRHIEAMPDETIVEMAGLVVTRQQPATAAGFIFLLLEDEFGLVNVVVKPDVYEASRQHTRLEPFLVVKGEIQHKEDTINLVAHHIRPMTVKEKPLNPDARSWA